MLSSRSPWQVTRSVWHALFMREALARTTADRMAWFWMIVEPLAMVGIMVGIRSVVVSGRHIGGVDFIPWLVCGLFGFFLFRENMLRSIGAIAANKALFTYRQVKPSDPVMVRCYLEGLLKSFVFLLFILLGTVLGTNLIPDDSLAALFIWASLWLLGVGAGLVLSTLSALVPEIGKIIRITSLPLLIISGVMLPLNYLPYEIQQYLLLNPIVHGLELLRESFFSEYREFSSDISLMYLWLWILSVNCLGLMLHLRFAMRLKSQ